MTGSAQPIASAERLNRIARAQALTHSAASTTPSPLVSIPSNCAAASSPNSLTNSCRVMRRFPVGVHQRNSERARMHEQATVDGIGGKIGQE